MSLHIALPHPPVHMLERSYVTVPMDPSSTTCTVFLVIFMFSGFLFNALVIIAILRTPSLRTISNGLMLQLSIADCVLSGVIGPVLLRNVIDGAWQNGMDTPSEWQASASMGACYLSIMSLTLISLHRYSAVVKGRSWTRNQTLRYCAPTWVMALALMVYSYFGVGEFDIEPGKVMAGYSWYKRGWNLIPAIHSFLTLVVCATVIALCYYQIYAFVANAAKELEAAFATKVTAEQKKQNRSQSKEIALAKRMIVIIGLFFACWSLYAILILYCLISGQPQPVGLDQVATILGHMNSMFNPLLFTYLDKRVQQAVYNLVMFKPVNYVRLTANNNFDATSQVHSSNTDNTTTNDMVSMKSHAGGRDRSSMTGAKANRASNGRMSFNPRASGANIGGASYNVSPQGTTSVNKRASTGMMYAPPKFLAGFPSTAEESHVNAPAVAGLQTSTPDQLRKLSLTVTADLEAVAFERSANNSTDIHRHINDMTPEYTRRRALGQIPDSVTALLTPELANRPLTWPAGNALAPSQAYEGLSTNDRTGLLSVVVIKEDESAEVSG